MWIELQEEDILTRLAGAELRAYRTAATAEDQDDPLPEVLAAVTDEVRGYVAACPGNRLGPVGRIPSRLKSAALDLARYRLTTRLPVRISEERKREYENAIRLLEQVARCVFAVEDPDGGERNHSAVELIKRRRKPGSSLDGL